MLLPTISRIAGELQYRTFIDHLPLVLQLKLEACRLPPPHSRSKEVRKYDTKEESGCIRVEVAGTTAPSLFTSSDYHPVPSADCSANPSFTASALLARRFVSLPSSLQMVRELLNLQIWPPQKPGLRTWGRQGLGGGSGIWIF